MARAAFHRASAAFDTPPYNVFFIVFRVETGRPPPLPSPGGPGHRLLRFYPKRRVSPDPRRSGEPFGRKEREIPREDSGHRVGQEERRERREQDAVAEVSGCKEESANRRLAENRKVVRSA